MKNLTDYIVELMVETQIINSKDKEIYIFGFRRIIISSRNYIIFFLIGVLFKIPLESILYILCFVPLRIFGGGVHAKSQTVCFVLSSLLSILVLIIIKFKSINISILILLSLLTSAITFRCAPVNCTENKINKIEKEYFKRKFRVILISAFMLGSVFFIAKEYKAVYSFAMAILTTNMLIFCGKLCTQKFKQ